MLRLPHRPDPQRRLTLYRAGLAFVVVLSLQLLVVWLIRPYRIGVFNICLLGLILAAFLDALLLYLEVTGLRSALLLEPGVSEGLAVINGCAAASRHQARTTTRHLVPRRGRIS